jgi:hypothetical protein
MLAPSLLEILVTLAPPAINVQHKHASMAIPMTVSQTIQIQPSSGVQPLHLAMLAPLLMVIRVTMLMPARSRKLQL